MAAPKVFAERAVPAATAPAQPDRPSLAARLADRGVDRVLLLLVPAVAIVGLLFVYPFVYGVLISFNPESGGAWANYQTFFADPYLRQTIWYTVRLALPVTAASLLIALPLAYRLRRAVRGKRVITLIDLPPAGDPGQCGAFRGTDHDLLSIRLGQPGAGQDGLGPVTVLYSYWGTFVAAVLGIVPLMLLLLTGFFGGIDPALEDAAATLGAGRTVRFWRVLFPLVLPGLITAVSLALVEAFAIFPSAVLVGEPNADTHVLSIPIYEAAPVRLLGGLGRRHHHGVGRVVLVELVVLGLLTLLRSRLYRGAAAGERADT